MIQHHMERAVVLPQVEYYARITEVGEEYYSGVEVTFTNDLVVQEVEGGKVWSATSMPIATLGDPLEVGDIVLVTQVCHASDDNRAIWLASLVGTEDNYSGSWAGRTFEVITDICPTYDYITPGGTSELVAGTGIDITGSTISVQLIAGSGIGISGATISLTEVDGGTW